MWIEQLVAASDVEPLRRRLLMLTEELGQVGSWVYAPEAGDLVWSDNLFRLFGLFPGALVPTPRYVASRIHPADLSAVRAAIASSLRHGDVAEISYRVLNSDDSLSHHVTRWATHVVASRGLVLIGSVRDVTERAIAEREIAAHAAVSDALSDWDTPGGGAALLLRKLGSALEAARGLLWVPRDGLLWPTVAWRAPDGEEFEWRVVDLRLKPGEGIAGRAWLTGDIVSVTDISHAPAYRFLAAAVRDRLRGAIAIPAPKGQQVLAVLSFASHERFDLSERLEGTLVGIAHEIGEFFARRHGQLAQPILTPRELDILRLAAEGCTAKEIASRLVVAESTVKTHLANVYLKLQVSDRAAAVEKALREGLID